MLTWSTGEQYANMVLSVPKYQRVVAVIAREDRRTQRMPRARFRVYIKLLASYAAITNAELDSFMIHRRLTCKTMKQTYFFSELPRNEVWQGCSGDHFCDVDVYFRIGHFVLVLFLLGTCNVGFLQLCEEMYVHLDKLCLAS